MKGLSVAEPIRQTVSRFRTSRPGMALSILRGMPVAYRLHMEGGTVIIDKPTTVVQCVFDARQPDHTHNDWPPAQITFGDGIVIENNRFGSRS